MDGQNAFVFRNNLTPHARWFIYIQGYLAAASFAYSVAVKLNPSFLSAKPNIAGLLLMQNKIQESLDHLNAIVKENFQYKSAHINMGNGKT